MVVADYVGGCVSALPVNEDGRLGEPSAFVQHAVLAWIQNVRRARTRTR